MNRSRIVKVVVVVCLSLLSLLLTPPARAANDTGAKEKPLFSFAVFSDVHVHGKWSPQHASSVQKFTQALRDIAPLQPEFLVIDGDLTNGRPEDYKQLRETYQQNAAFPLYPTMGNHEYYFQWTNKKWNDRREKQQFLNEFGLRRLYYDRYEHGFHFIFLSPEQYMPRQKKIGEAAWLSPEQIKWFERTLLASKAPTFVFLHQPLNKTVFSVDFGLSAVQSDQLLKIARKHPQVIWFSGHSHISTDSKTEAMHRDGILFVGSGSVFEPEDLKDKPAPGAEKYGSHYLVVDPAKSESRYVDVYADHVEIRTRFHNKAAWGKQAIEEPLRTAPDHNRTFTRLFVR